MSDLTPIPIEERCDPCEGMGGFSRGTAFDCCGECRGEGKRVRLMCPAPGLGEVPCAERLHRTAVQFDQQQTSIYGCVNGHRFRARLARGFWEWSRLEDRALEVAVA